MTPSFPLAVAIVATIVTIFAILAVVIDSGDNTDE